MRKRFSDVVTQSAKAKDDDVDVIAQMQTLPRTRPTHIYIYTVYIHICMSSSPHMAPLSKTSFGMRHSDILVDSVGKLTAAETYVACTKQRGNCGTHIKTPNRKLSW